MKPNSNRATSKTKNISSNQKNGLKPNSQNTIRTTSKTKSKIYQPNNPNPNKTTNNRIPLNNSKTIINKPPTKSVFPKLSRNNTRKNKYEHNGVCSWATLSCNSLIDISMFACSTLFQIYQLSRVCSNWRNYMMGEMGECFWQHMKAAQQITTFYDFKLLLQKSIIQDQEKASLEFEKYFTKLFNYGSTKQNIPNKLLQRLNLQIEIKLNKDAPVSQPFKLRSFNFSSYLCMKIQQINQYKYEFNTPHNMFKDKVELEVTFRSKKYKVSHKIKKSYVPEELYQKAIKQKAFNYYLDKNFVFTCFEGDNHFLYIFFEISVLDLVNIFRKIIKNKHQQVLNKRAKKVPMYKQLCETQFQNFVQYMKFQTDFQIHFSYHNSLKQIFTHCDTKVYPIQIDSKQALFDVKVDDVFDKVATYKLDNKMGMSESVEDLYLLDFILKDRDRFLIIFSGFIYARDATQKERQSIEDYFNYSENRIKIMEYRKQKEYWMQFVIIEEKERNLMKRVRLRMSGSMINL